MNRMRSQFFSDRTRNECQELSKQLDKLIDLVKEQKETSFNMQQQVESLTVLVEETSNDLKSLGEEVTSLKRTTMEKLESSACSTPKHRVKKPKLDKDLSALVRDVHDSLAVKFDGTQLFNSPHNKEVSQGIRQQLNATESSSTYNQDQVNRAVHRYYESRRRLFNDSQPHREATVAQNKKKAKKKAFQKRLYDRRSRVLLTEKETKYWATIDEQYMTEESEDEDENIVRHQLQWCSNALQSLKELLDTRIKSAEVINGRYTQKRRISGAPSLSPIIPGAPSWAVKSDTGVAVPLRNITNVQTTPSTRHDRPTSATSDPNQTVDQLRSRTWSSSQSTPARSNFCLYSSSMSSSPANGSDTIGSDHNNSSSIAIPRSSLSSSSESEEEWEQHL